MTVQSFASLVSTMADVESKAVNRVPDL